MFWVFMIKIKVEGKRRPNRVVFQTQLVTIPKIYLSVSDSIVDFEDHSISKSFKYFTIGLVFPI
jgi:hypothetical protein